MLHTQTN